MSNATNATSGLFFSSVPTQQTKSHNPDKPAKRARPLSKAEKDWERDAERQGYLTQPASGIELAFRHRAWLQDRNRVLAALRAANVATARIERFCNCGSDSVVEVNATGTAHRIRANYCGERWCEPCQKARGKKLAAELKTFIEKEPTQFITMGLRADGKNLIQRRQRLLRSFAMLRRAKFFRSKITGGAFVVQTTRGKSGGHWHVHLHVLCHGRFLKQKHLVAAWQRITKDSFIVDWRRVTDSKKAADYVARYASKGCDSSVLKDPDALCEAVVALRGGRMFATWGSWRGCRVEHVRRDDTGWRRVGRLVDIYNAARRREAWAVGVFKALTVAVRDDVPHVEFLQLGNDGRGPSPGAPA